MNINFYLQAVPNFKGHLRVVEFYELVGGGWSVGVDGNPRPAIELRGMVDDDIKNVNAKEYAEFQKALAPQWEALAEKARANPGVAVYLSEPEVKASPEPLPEKVDPVVVPEPEIASEPVLESEIVP